MSTNLTPPSFPTTSIQSSSSITITLTIIILVFLFIGFFSLYFCRCFMEIIFPSSTLGRTPSGNIVGASSSPPNNGLDPSLIKSFPTFPYSTIKDFRTDKYGLECAICLVEFEDESFLRLLTVCCHVFHQECIDLWLDSHKTCPVCRRCLDSSEKPDQNNLHESERGSLDGAVSIEIAEDGDGDGVGETEPSGSNGSKEKRFGEDGEMGRFSRSHSTGHSIVRNRSEGEEEDRYRLRLPEHIKIKIIRGHNWTGSCVTFEELSHHQPNSGGFAEVSGSQSQER